jgi:hypothetical protein
VKIALLLMVIRPRFCVSWKRRSLARRKGMISRGIAVLGLLALVCAGCATGTRSVVSGANGNGGDGGAWASPITSESQHCEGWYDTAARACDSMGD